MKLHTLILTAVPFLGVAQAATCDLSYLPLGKVTYRVSLAGATQTFTMNSQEEVDGASGSASSLDTTYRWTCVGKDLHSLIKMSGVTIDLNQGTFMPAANLWKVGYTWTNAATSFSDADPENTITAKAVNRIVAQEKVKVPAGTFNAYRVEAQAILPDGGTQEMTFWYVQGYGMVKQVDHATTAVTELMKFQK